MSTVLVVDDERKLTAVLKLALSDEGYEVHTANDPLEALAIAQAQHFDVVVTDIRMPRMDGLELVEGIRQLQPDCAFVLMTAFASVDTAVRALKQGVADYLLKPFQNEALVALLDRLCERRRLLDENTRLRERLQSVEPSGEILGSSAVLQDAIRLAHKVARSDANVLLRGESGTGKELFARLIHSASGRSEAPLVEVHAAALPEALLESELFGHERGAFTGAEKLKRGKFELANGGTLFLDEVGELPPSMQVKLLRAIQERRFERIGGLRPIQMDARFIAATHVNLEDAIRAGRFREDLYYRLNVITITLPPLRERPEDVPLLAKAFLARYGRPGVTIAAPAMAALQRYRWPGNVRELRNVIERACVIVDGDRITEAELPFGVDSAHAVAAAPAPGLDAPSPGASTPQFSLDEWERRLVQEAYERAGQVKTRTAQLLGLTRRQLDSKLRRHRIGEP